MIRFPANVASLATRKAISTTSTKSSIRGGAFHVNAIWSNSRVVSKIYVPPQARATSTLMTSLSLRSPQGLITLRRTKLPSSSLATTRSLSSNGGGDKGGKPNTGPEDPTSQELVLTPGQKVVAGTRLTMWLGVGAFALACAYYIGKELLPSKMSANSVFDKAFDRIKENQEVMSRFGAPLKAYGRDHGGHREGRRNFIEHTEYTDKEDGSKRTRVRFNLEGQFGHAFVFAEVSSDMDSGEFVYLLVQDKRNGRVITIVDNRSALIAKRMAGGSKEGMDAFSNLLTGGKK